MGRRGDTSDHRRSVRADRGDEGEDVARKNTSALRRDPLTSERRRHAEAERRKWAECSWGEGEWADGRMGGLGVREGRMWERGDVSGRVESGDQEVEGKFSVKVFANKGITMQGLFAPASPSSSSHLLCHCHSLQLSFFLSPALLSVSSSLCFYCWPWFPPRSSLPRSWHSSLFL